MNKYVRTGLVAAAVLLGFWSCANDNLANDQKSTSGRTNKVVLTLDNGKQTRAAATQNDRETAIDVTKTFAVVFDYDSQNGKAYALTQSGTDYTFEVPEAGAYYLYVVANTTAISDGTTFADPSALLSTIESGNPGSADNNTATNFLMLSPKLLLDIDGKNDTEVAVTLTRAAARIDIEAFSDFTITSVELTNRYVTTKYGRTTTTTSMETALSDDKQATKIYSGLSGDGITANIWNGAIYTYENLSSADAEKTKVKVTGTNTAGESFSVEGTFDNIKRNHAYKLIITNNEEEPTFDKLKMNILVATWIPGETLQYTSLTDTDVPEFYVTTADYNELTGGTVSGTETKNPTMGRVSRKTAKSYTIRVVGKKVGSQIVCANGASGVTITEADPTDDGNGNILQTFTVTLNPSVSRTTTVLNIYNRLNEPNPLTFTIKSWEIGMNPLWYMANYYLAEDMESFDTNCGWGTNYMFDWATTMSMGYTASSDQYDGYALPATPKTIGGVAYHVPTCMEWLSVFPPKDSETLYNESFIKTGSTNGVITEHPCTFGYSNETKYSNSSDNTVNTGIEYQSYWSNYIGWSTINVNDDFYRYAIRFLGTDYCSVWRYKMTGSVGSDRRWEISAILIDPIYPVDLTGCADKLSEIMSKDESFWNDNETKGAVKRITYLGGHTNDGNSKNYNQSNKNGHAWSTTKKDGIGSVYIWNMSGQYINPNSPALGFNILLFRDGR